MKNYTISLFKQYLKSKYTYLSLFLPILFIIGTGQFLPSGLILSSSITLGILVSVLFLFGGNIQDLRKTSLIKSLSLTEISKLRAFLVNVFVSFVLILISIFIIFWFVYFLDYLGFIVEDLSNFNPTNPGALVALNYSITWTQIDWVTLIYSILVTVFLTFAISFLIISFTKTSNTLYICSFIYIFIVILAGGVIIPSILGIISDSFVQYIYKFVPHYYSNNLMSTALVSQNSWLNQKLLDIDNPLITAIIQSIFEGRFVSIEDFNWDAINNDVQYLTPFFNSEGNWVGSFINETGTVIEFDINQLQSETLRLITDFDLETIIINVLSFSNIEVPSLILGAKSWEDVLYWLDGTGSENSIFGFQTFVQFWESSHIKVIIVKIWNNLIKSNFGENSFLFFNGDVKDFAIFIQNGILSLRDLNIMIILGGSGSSLNSLLGLLSDYGDVLVAFFKNTTPWDFKDLDSVLNSFLPLILGGAIASISIFKFEWYIR